MQGHGKTYHVRIININEYQMQTNRIQMPNVRTKRIFYSSRCNLHGHGFGDLATWSHILLPHKPTYIHIIVVAILLD